MRLWRWCVVLLLGAAAAGGLGARLDEMTLRDSLRQMPRWEQVRWLAGRWLPDPYLRDCTPTEDSGLRCVGRWSHGPSTWVDVRATPADTIVFLSRGSGVSVVRFRSQDSLRLDLLADINSRSLTGRCQVRDTLLYVNSGGVECYDINNLTSPVLLNWLGQPLMYDFFVVDTLLYTSSRDSLRIFSVANPASPRQLGACADSGYVMYVADGHAYLGHQAGLFVLDVTNPAAPHRVATLGFDVLSIWVRDTLLYFGTYDSTFRVYNVETPATPAPVGSLSGIAPACLYQPPACDTIIYSPAFDVISVANPAVPRRVGSVSPPGWEYGVAAVPALNYALVADCFDGLAAIDITNPTAPSIDTFLFSAGLSEDVFIDQGRAYVAQHQAGLRILDVTNPASPYLLGQADTLGTRPSTHTAVARDSFAYVGWTGVPYFRSFDVSDPTRPRLVGGLDIVNPAEDMVLRDTFVYVAEDGRLQIVNIARPRAPQVVGTLALPERSREVILSDTLVYIANLYSAIVVNVARATAPEAVGSWTGRVNGIGLADTVLYVLAPETLWALNVANPQAPVTIGFVPVTRYMHDVVVVDTIAYCVGWSVQTVNVADPSNMMAVGQPWSPVNWVRRAVYEPPYLYFCCMDGGVCVLETLQTALAESHGYCDPRGVRVEPSVTTGRVRFWSAQAQPVRVSVYRASGAKATATAIAGNNSRGGMIDLSCAPGGVYLLRFVTGGGSYTMKVVKTTGR